MDEEVAALTAVAGALTAPLAVWAVRWAPAAGRPDHPVQAGGPPVLAVGVALAGTLAVIGGRVGADPALGAYLVFGVALVVLVAVDLRWHRLPDVLTLPSYLVGAALLGLAALVGSDTGDLGRAAAGAAIGFGAYAVLYLAVRTGIGAGDVKYAGVIGMHAGWLGWGSLTVALVGGFVVGGLLSALLLLTGRARLATRIPFGPAMAVGALVGIGWGEPIVAAWLGR